MRTSQTDRASESACLYPAAGITARDVLMRRPGISTMDSHTQKRRKRKY